MTSAPSDCYVLDASALYHLSLADRVLGASDHDLGECTVLAHAELYGSIAVIDDRRARKVAKRHGIQVQGTIGILCRACREGRLTETNGAAILNALRQTGFRFGDVEFARWCRDNDLL